MGVGTGSRIAREEHDPIGPPKGRQRGDGCSPSRAARAFLRYSKAPDTTRRAPRRLLPVPEGRGRSPGLAGHNRAPSERESFAPPAFFQTSVLPFDSLKKLWQASFRLTKETARRPWTQVEPTFCRACWSCWCCATLAIEPMRGWGMAQRIEQMSGEVFAIQQGMLYPALQRLKRKGGVRSDWRVTENNRRATTR